MSTEQKAKAYEREVAAEREQWRLSQFPQCMYCDESPQWPPLAVHEIERRAHAVKRWAEPCNFLLLCERCHAGEFATMPHAKQLAVKFLRDRENYDLDAWLRLRDPAMEAPRRVTQEEVVRWVKRLSSGMSWK